MISIRNLWKGFGAQQVLAGVSLEVQDGEMIAVVGPSGTGKSVLLKIITGLLDADRGEVLVSGRSMTGAKSGRERREICSTMGVLFQGAALFDSLTLFDNVTFPLRERGVLSKREIEKRALYFLDEVGLRGFEKAYPGEVSIGMRKRVGIARALVTEPKILLFDEPNTGLDPQTGQEIYDLINVTHKKLHFTGITVSHEIPEVFQICSRVAMLYQGKVQVDGPVDAFLASANEVVGQFRKGETSGPIVMS